MPRFHLGYQCRSSCSDRSDNVDHYLMSAFLASIFLSTTFPLVSLAVDHARPNLPTHSCIVARSSSPHPLHFRLITSTIRAQIARLGLHIILCQPSPGHWLVLSSARRMSRWRSGLRAALCGQAVSDGELVYVEHIGHRSCAGADIEDVRLADVAHAC